jgi:hypothetical protein
MQLPVATGLKADKGIELLTWGTPNGTNQIYMATTCTASLTQDQL